MTASLAAAGAPGAYRRRFERVAITSIFGDPRHPRTWSGAPNNLACAFEGLGIEVRGIHPRLSDREKLLLAGRNLLAGYPPPANGEALYRTPAARRARALKVSRQARALGIRDVLHTGTLDLPAVDDPGEIRHYLYCDHSWDLARRYRTDLDAAGRAALSRFEALEAAAYRQMTHIFTFGDYVRRNLIDHYGVPAARVTTVGSGMGSIRPYGGPKDYRAARLLFVAKHYFEQKGGRLVLDAFRAIARQRREAWLTVVGAEPLRWLAAPMANVEFLPYVPWARLERLFREATLLVQPMLNDPWGQVYLEALLSRTPVVGLDRNGLPEIAGHGRYGVLIAEARADALAAAVLSALDQPNRLAAMALAGQQHVLETYSWDRVARRIAEVDDGGEEEPEAARAAGTDWHQ
ncbi:MAG TPA: glycosyltransferase family 4 protein [Alphaproteobacteria bacterium]|nr:glycosyltransferase family 4 protein [Alphaproteobacteria bacterium]